MALSVIKKECPSCGTTTVHINVDDAIIFHPNSHEIEVLINGLDAIGVYRLEREKRYGDTGDELRKYMPAMRLIHSDTEDTILAGVLLINGWKLHKDSKPIMGLLVAT